MNTQQQVQLCSFEQAKKLKKLGFDWACDSFYCTETGEPDLYIYEDYLDHNGEVLCQDYEEEQDGICDDYFSAPTVALALKWFRDVKNEMNAVICEHDAYGIIMYSYYFTE